MDWQDRSWAPTAEPVEKRWNCRVDHGPMRWLDALLGSVVSDPWTDHAISPRGVFGLQIRQEVRDSRVEGVERVG
jgi:hypothetical protein